METEVKPRIIRDKAFAKRLEIACEANPHCPTDQQRGKQKWLYDNLREHHAISLSPEAVRKWFAGESRPRPKVMSAVARLLEVDEAWLSLGLKPDLTPREQKERNASADGAVNLVAGLIQMAGGHIAFPDRSDAGCDLMAIIGGKHHAIEVRMAFDLGADRVRFIVGDRLDENSVIGLVPTDDPLRVRLLRLTPEIVRTHGEMRGDFWEIVATLRGDWFKAGNDTFPEIVDLRDPAGLMPQPPPRSGVTSAVRSRSSH